MKVPTSTFISVLIVVAVLLAVFNGFMLFRLNDKVNTLDEYTRETHSKVEDTWYETGAYLRQE